VCARFKFESFWFQGVLHVLRNPETTNLRKMDVQNKSYDLFGANRQLLPFEINFKTLYSDEG
jgi:hypothetical protein